MTVLKTTKPKTKAKAKTTPKKPRVWNRRTELIPSLVVNVAHPSRWANPWRHLPRELAVESFKRYLEMNPRLVEQARIELKGKDLMCWCSSKENPQLCHAHIWIEVANSKGPLPWQS